MRIRPIRPEDDAAMAEIMRTVMLSYGVSGPGTAMEDPEVDALSSSYPGDKSQYFVIEDGQILGGAGFGPLAGGSEGICELRKVYLKSEARGRGLGRALVMRMLELAAAEGYRTCYLETVPQMVEAHRLYERLGFRMTTERLGDTGHTNCGVYYLRDLGDL